MEKILHAPVRTRSEFHFFTLVMSGALFILLPICLVVLPQLASAATLTRTLELGMSGEDVTALQAFLATNRHIYPEGIASGYFGPLTKEAVRQFQVAYDIEPVGRVGPVTMAKINAIMNSGLGLDTDAPVASNFTAVASSTGVMFNWMTNEPAWGQVNLDINPIQSSEATSHQIPLSVSGTAYVVDPQANLLQGVFVQGLAQNTRYYFFAQAKDRSGNVSIAREGSFQVGQ